MDSTWEIEVRDSSGLILGNFIACRMDMHTGYSDCVDYLVINMGCYLYTGQIAKFVVFRNGIHYAEVKPSLTIIAHAGAHQSGSLLVMEEHLLGNHAMTAPIVCNCGCWVAYGKNSNLHSDWCDVK